MANSHDRAADPKQRYEQSPRRPSNRETKRTHEPQNPQACGIVFDDNLYLSFVEQIHALSSMIRGK